MARRLRGPAAHRRAAPAARRAEPGAVEVRTFRSATSESAYAGPRAARGAPARRRALVADGGDGPLDRAGSCRRCGGPCTPPGCRPSCTARTCRCTCSRRSRRCCCCCAARWSRTGSTRRPRSRCCTRRSAAPTRSPSGGCGRGCGRWRWPAGDRRPSGELLVEALRDPAELAAVDRRWAEPGAGGRRGCSPPPGEAAAAPGATAEDVLWAVWRASGLAERWSAAITRGRAAAGEDEPRRRWRAEAADRDLDAVLVLFDAAARFTDRLPGARTEVFLDHVLGQELPADTLAAERRPGRGGPAAHRARRQGPGVGPGRRGRRAGGRLAGPAAARQPARLRAAGRRAGRPGRRRRRPGQPGRADLGAARRGAPAVLRRGHPGPAAAAGHRGRLGGGRRRRPRGAAEPVPARAGRRRPRPDRRGDAGGPSRRADTGRPAARRPATADRRGRRSDATPEAERAGGAAGDPAAAGAHPAGAGGRAAYRGHRPGGAGRPAARGGGRAGPARRRRGARRAPGRLVGAARRSPTTGRWSTRASRSGSPRRRWRARCGAACAGCWNGTAAAARPAPRRASATWCTPPRCSPRTPAPTGPQLLEYVAARFDAIELAARWMAGPERARAEAMVDKLLRWLAGNPRRLLAIEHEFAVRLDDPSRPIELTGRVDRLEVDADGPAGRGRPQDRQVHRGHRARSWPSIRSSARTRWRSRRARSPSSATESGGAALVQLGTGAKDAREQAQAAAGERPDAGWAQRAGPADRRHDGRRDLRRGGQLEVPGLPGAHQLPGLRQGPPGGRAADRPSPGAPRDRSRPCSAPPTPAPRTADAGPRYTPVELAKLLRLHAPTREQAAIIAAPVEPLLVVAGRRLRQDRDDGRPGGLAGRQRLRPAGADPRAHLHPQGRRRAGAPDPDPARPAGPPARPAAARPARRPARRRADRRHLPLVRGADRHRARAAGRLRADHPAAHRGGPLAARRRCWCATTTATCPRWTGCPSTVTDAVLALAGELAEHLVDPGRAGRLDRPVLRRGAGPPRPGLRRRAQGARPPAGPAAAAAAGAGVRAGARATSRRWTSATSWPGPPGWPGTTPRSARSSGTGSGWCCSTSTRTPATPRWCCCSSLFGGGHPVTAVGDPCQSIYGWRGASAGTLDRFPAEFPRAGRRAGRGAVADHAAGATGRRSSTWPTRSSAPLRAAGARVPELRAALSVASRSRTAARAGSRRHRALRAAGDVRRRGRRGSPTASLAAWRGAARMPDALPEHIPVTQRPTTRGAGPGSRSQIPAIEAALRARGLPVEVVGLGGLLDTPEVRDVVCTLRVLADPTDGAALLRLLTGARWRIGPRDLVALHRRARAIAARPARSWPRRRTDAGDRRRPARRGDAGRGARRPRARAGVLGGGLRAGCARTARSWRCCATGWTSRCPT